MTRRPAPLLIGTVALACAVPLAAQSEITRFEGLAAQDFARAVALVGDVDGDGFADVAIGSAKAPEGGQRRGRVELRSGRTQALLHSFSGTADFQELGFAVAGVGDVDDDGVPDVAAGTFGGNYARVWSGADGSVLHTFTTLTSGDLFGYSVAGAGDVDGDGHADVIVGTNRVLVFAPGFARVFSGATGGVLHTVGGDAAFDGFGNAVAGGKDVNGDGVPDFAVGAPALDATGTDAGRVRVFSGLDGSPLLTFDGDGDNDELGSSVALLDDVDGDGRAEVAAGAPGCGIAFGCPGEKGYVRVWNGTTGAVRFTRKGKEAQSLLGVAVASAGDVDGDGRGDLVFGASGANDRGLADCGMARVVRGLDGAAIFTVYGETAGAGLGFGLAAGRDVNGDGTPDVVAGSLGGRARVLSIALARSCAQVSVAAGGEQELSLVAGAANAGRVVALLGSLQGTSPGTTVDGLLLPLELGLVGAIDGGLLTQLVFLALRSGDSAWLEGLVSPVPGGLPVLARAGRLDERGEARATLEVPAGAFPGLAGTSVHHAYLVFAEGSKVAVLASNAAELALAP